MTLLLVIEIFADNFFLFLLFPFTLQPILNSQALQDSLMSPMLTLSILDHLLSVLAALAAVTHKYRGLKIQISHQFFLLLRLYLTAYDINISIKLFSKIFYPRTLNGRASCNTWTIFIQFPMLLVIGSVLKCRIVILFDFLWPASLPNRIEVVFRNVLHDLISARQVTQLSSFHFCFHAWMIWFDDFNSLYIIWGSSKTRASVLRSLYRLINLYYFVFFVDLA